MMPEKKTTKAAEAPAEEEEDDVFAELSAPLPLEGRQQAPGRATGKKYDMDGFGYQWIADRFNATLGVYGWWFDYDVVHEDTGSWGKSGRSWVEITVKVTIYLTPSPDDTHTAYRVCAGGHKSDNYPDALKGAITNGFKKCAAFFGPGRAAYSGTIDDDYRPMDPGANDNGRAREPRKLPDVVKPAAERPALKAVGDAFRQLKVHGIDWKSLFDPPIDPTTMSEQELGAVLAVAKNRIQLEIDINDAKDPPKMEPGNLADGFRNESGVKF